MSRFTASILAATALLGVLLWVVISMAVEFARAPAEPLPMPTDDPVIQLDPELPRVASRDELVAWLDSNALDGELLVDDLQAWLYVNGFPDQHLEIASDEISIPSRIDSLDDAALLILACNGDLHAMQMLGDRSLQIDDPLEALNWYDRAVVNGSLFAMLRVADLITTLSDPALAEFVSNAAWQEAIDQQRAETPAPRERALAWSLAAVIAGGYGVIDPAQADRINILTEQLDVVGVARACDTAQAYVLDAATARRAQGGAVFSSQQPALALTVANPEELIPCDIPLVPLVPLNGCRTYEFVSQERLLNAWVCGV